jgi:hypothetical protein
MRLLGNGISQPIRTFTDGEALDWIKARGEVNLAPSDLARQFRWPQQRVHRLLEDWEREGAIYWQGNTIVGRRKAAEGAVRVADIVADKRVAAPAVDLQTDLRSASVPARGLQEAGAGKRVIRPPVLASAPSSASSVQSITAAESVEDAISVSALPARSRTARMAAWVLGLAAVSLGLVALAINARFMWGFGRSQDAAAMLAILGFVIDLLAVVLPTVAMELWWLGHRPGSALAWCCWVVAVSMTLMASAGWSATNIGDAIAGRSMASDRTGSLVDRLDRARGDRAMIHETRSVAAIEAALQRAQGFVGDAWQSTRGCSNVTVFEGARACRAVLTLRAAKGDAIRRDELDRMIADAEHELAGAPVIAVADPGSQLIASVTSLPEATVQRLRLVGLTIMPALAGLLLGLAVSLRQPRRGLRASRIG